MYVSLASFGALQSDRTSLFCQKKTARLNQQQFAGAKQGKGAQGQECIKNEVIVHGCIMSH
jgi:hypothetical protein